MKKIRISDLQNDIIWALEEAGSETLDVLRITFCTNRDHDERMLVEALQGLEGLGFVKQDESEVILTAQGRAALTR